MIRMTVEQIDNAFILTTFDDVSGEQRVTSYTTPKQLVREIRTFLGLKPTGRPKITSVVATAEAEVGN